MDNSNNHLVIKNQAFEILTVSEWLKTYFKQNSLPSELLYKFDLCSNEAITNIISYGFKGDAEHEIHLHLFIEDTKVSLEITDLGIPFNPLEQPEHTQATDIKSAEIGGLGIDLIKHYVDACCYSREGDKNVFKIILQRI